MDARPAEFFIILAEEPHKVKGVVFNYKGRLLGVNDGVKGGETIVWSPIGIKTGMSIGLTTRNPLDKENTLDDLIECFDDFCLDEQKRCAEKIKAAYEANPDVKRQVFGGIIC